MNAPTITLPEPFDAFLDHLTRVERRAPATVSQVRTALRHLAVWCGDHNINPLELTPRQADAWAADLGSHVGAGAQGQYVYKIRRTYRWLASRRAGRVIPEDPTDELAGPSVYVPQGLPISDDDLDLALRAAPAGSALRCWLLLEAGTGIRPVQMASLTRRRVHYEAGRALLNVRGKGRELTVVAGPDIADALRPFTRTEVGALWINQAGRPVNANNVTKAINRHLHGLGIRDVTSHGLRRWFADHAAELADLRTVQELLGHASLDTTARYLRPKREVLGTVADALSARLARRSAS